MEDSGARYIEINSALVSAQNRQRFYVHNCGGVGQPEDRGIMLSDILESGVTDKDKAYCLKHQAGNARDYFKKHHTQVVYEPVIIQNAHGFNKGGVKQGKTPTLTANGKWIYNNPVAIPCGTRIAEPIRIGALPRPNGELSTSAGMRIYSADGKGRCLIANGGGQGAKTGLYAIPTDKPVYEVKDGFITIKGKQYPIKLADGYYIIRKLTVAECCRLQTLPDDYCRAVSDSQAYKGLGNGWTAEVIIHILRHALDFIPKNEKILVLSMYDGIGTGRYCLDRLGFTNVEYHAYEIDKYAMTIARSNYPDIIYHGDAFQVRADNWEI